MGRRGRPLLADHRRPGPGARQPPAGLLQHRLQQRPALGIRQARRWNDPDYMLIGWVGDAHRMGVGHKTTLTPNEQYSYMSMWCLMAAPLIFSGDMAQLDPFTLNVLCNAEVIDVDQDALGRQARIVRKTPSDFILLKDLEDGSRPWGFSTWARRKPRFPRPGAIWASRQAADPRFVAAKGPAGGRREVPGHGAAAWGDVGETPAGENARIT